jgi:hypothetical protein
MGMLCPQAQPVFAVFLSGQRCNFDDHFVLELATFDDMSLMSPDVALVGESSDFRWE